MVRKRKAQTRQLTSCLQRLVLTTLIGVSLNGALAAECFPGVKNRLPHAFFKSDQKNTNDMDFSAIAGWTDPSSLGEHFIVYGGTNQDADFWQYSKTRTDKKVVIARMDLKTNVVRWQRHYDVLDSVSATAIKNKFLTNLAISPDGTKVVAYSQEHAWEDSDNSGYIFVIRSVDGDYVSKKARSVVHDSSDNKARFTPLSNSAIYFTSYGTVIMALTQDSKKTDTIYRPCSNNAACASRMRIAQYNVASEQFDWYYEQEKWFGNSMAVAFGEWGQTADNIYLGGAADHTRFQAPTDPSSWGLALYHLSSAGKRVELWKLKINGAWSAKDIYPRIYHMKLFKSAIPDPSDSSRTLSFLYGTTQGSMTNQARHEQVYFWRVKLRSDHKIDTSAVLIKKIEIKSVVDKDGYVLGISNELEADAKQFHLIYLSYPEGKTYYMRVNFDATAVTAIQLFITSSNREMQSVFVGTRTSAIGSFDYIKQAYIATSTKTYAPNFNSDHTVGIVLPTIRSETCLTVTDATLTFTLTDASAASKFEKHLEADEKDFTTTTLTMLNQSPFNYQINDVELTIMNNNKWCTNFSETFDSLKIIQGFVYNNLGLCSLTFDNNMVSIPFIMPQYQASGGCTVSDDQWTTWISLDTGSAVYESDKVKIAIDTKSSTIKVMGLSDFSSTYSNRLLKFMANFKLPNGEVTSFPFSVNTSPSVASCQQPTINPPSSYITQMTYAVGDRWDENKIEPFVIASQTGCPSISQQSCPAYKATVKGDTGQKDLSFFNEQTGSSIGKGKWWETSNSVHTGSYKVTVHATCLCSAKTASFTVNVVSACSVETISISSSSFVSPFISYNIQDLAHTETWTSSAVTAAQTEATCGGFSWEITNQDETKPLDMSIFTFDSSLPSLRVQSSDTVKAGTYNLRVKVHRTNIPTVSAQKDFTVQLIDVCNSPLTVTVTPPTPPGSQVYIIGNTKISQVFGQFSVTPSYCSTTLDWSVSPTPNDSFAIQVSTADRQVNIYSMDLASGMETSPTTSVPKSYLVTVFLVTSNGTKLNQDGKRMQFQVDLTNPCVSATINLDAVLPATIPDYLIGSAEQTIQFVFSNANDQLGSLCPSSKTFEVIKSDGSQIDSSVWTFSATSESLQMLTVDQQKAGTYTLRLRVKYNVAVYTQWQGTKDFVLKLINPCLTCTLTLTPAQYFASTSLYYLNDPDLSLSWAGAALYTQNSGIDCGAAEVVFEVRKDGAAAMQAVDSSIFTVDQTRKKLTKLSTTLSSQIGVYEFQYKVKLTVSGTESAWSTPTFTIEVKDPCPTATLTVPSQVNPADYSYSGVLTSFTLSAFTVTPSHCAVTYTCLTKVGPTSPTVEICAFNTGPSDQATFSGTTWTFKFTDTFTYAPGQYTLEVKASTGGGSSTITHDFTFNLVNPCPTLVLTHSVSLFTSLTGTYTLGEATKTWTWGQRIANQTPNLPKCGDYEVEIHYDDPNDTQGIIQATSTSLFRADVATKTVTYPVGASTANVGSWKAYYKVYLKTYPTVKSALSQAFTLTIVDQCAAPVLTYSGQNADFGTYRFSNDNLMLKFEAAAMFVYSGATTLTLPTFTTDLPVCPITYSCTATGPSGADATAQLCPTSAINDGKTSCSFDPSAKQWSFKTIDVKNANYAPGTYTLVFKGTSGTNQDRTVTVSATVVLTDPCPTSLVLQSPSPLTAQTYILRDPQPAPQSWSGTDLVSVTTPALCGSLQYAFFLKDLVKNTLTNIQTLSASQNPFVIDLTAKTFTIAYTQTTSLVGEYNVVYKVNLEGYESQSVESSPFKMTIVDPCVSPALLTASTLPSSVIEYTVYQAAVQTIVPPFTVSPTWCSIAYTSVNFPQYWTAATRSFSFSTNDINETLKTQPFYRDISESVRADSGDKSATLSFQWRVHNPCINPAFNQILTPADSTVEYEVGSVAKVVYHKVGYSVKLAVCGSIKFIVSSGLSLQISENTVEDSLKIYTTDLALVNSFQTVTVSTILKDYPSAKGVAGPDVQIKVKFVECKVEAATVPKIENQTYQIGSTAIEFPISAFSSADADRCNYTWSYSVQLAKKPTGQGTIDSYMKFDESTRKFEIYSTSGIEQTLEVALVGTLSNKQTFNSTFSVTYTKVKELAYQMVANLPAEFVQPLKNLTEVDFSKNRGQETQSVNVGRLSDFEDDPFSVTFSGTEDASFLRPRIDTDGNIVVDIDNHAAKESGRNGIYTVKIEVKQVSQDGKVFKQLFSFGIQLGGLPELSPALPFIQPQDGPQVNKTVAEVYQPTLKIKSINRVGDVDILFSEPLLIPKDFSAMNETDLNVTATAFDPEMQVFMGLTWKVATFAPDRMTIKVTFENPAQIARDMLGKDLLKIKVLNIGKFLSQKYRAPVAEGTELTAKLSQQMTESKQEVVVRMEEQAESIKDSSSAVAGSSFAINILLASSLSLLWGLINSLQLITHFPLINVLPPINVVTYFRALYEIATMNMIPLDYFQEQIEISVGDSDKSDEVFDAEAVLSQSTIESGYDSANIINGSIQLWSVVGLGVLGALSLCVLRRCCKKCDCMQKFADKVWRMIFWNFIIRTLSESYLELSMKMMIRLFAIEAFSWWEIISTGYTLGTLAVMLLFTLLSPVLLHCKKAQLQTHEFIMKYGSLTEQMDTRKDLQKFYYFMFTLRRLALSVIIIQLPLRPWAQIQLLCFKCSLHIIYIGLAKPYTLSWMNCVEITNEFGILANTYFLFLYSDAFLMIYKSDQLIKDDVLQEQVGWFHVGLLGLLLGFNIVVMLTVQVLSIYHFIKMRVLKKRHAKAMMLYEGRRILKEHLRRTEENQKKNLMPDPQTGQIRQNVYDFKMKRQRQPQHSDQLQSIEEVPSKDEERSISQRSNLSGSDNLISLGQEHAPVQSLGHSPVEAVFRAKKTSIQVKLSDRAQYDGLEQQLRQEQSMLLKGTTAMISTLSKPPTAQIHVNQTNQLIEEETFYQKQVQLQNALIIAPEEAVPVRAEILAKTKPKLAMADFALNREEIKEHRPKESTSNNLNTQQMMKDQVKEMQKEAHRKHMERQNGFL